KEVNKYLTKDVNYGKAAKRMYNIFRLTGRYEDAAFLRELFDEPATMLYQVWSLIRTIDDCCNPNSPITVEDMLAQNDRLILAVVVGFLPALAAYRAACCACETASPGRRPTRI
ncbi:MAG: hypothetical protein ACWGO1_09060, partial [Anaerolineales bacterium]